MIDYKSSKINRKRKRLSQDKQVKYLGLKNGVTRNTRKRFKTCRNNLTKITSV